MINNGLRLKFLIFFLFSSIVSAQIKLLHLHPAGIPAENLVNNSDLKNRNILFLNDGWQFYKAGEPSKKTDVNLPIIFSNRGKFVFEKSFKLPANFKNKQFKLFIYGLNYSADITLNDITIARNVGMGLPIELKISTSLLNFNNPNNLKITLTNRLDSKNTLPVNQRFLLPRFYGGINGNVLLEVLPEISIGAVKINTNAEFSQKFFECKVEVPLNYETASDNPQPELSNLRLKVKLLDSSDNEIITQKEVKKLSEKNNVIFVVKKARFWSPEEPFNYKLKIDLLNGDEILDEFSEEFPVFKFSVSPKGISFNGKKFEIKGTTYSLIDQQIAEKDLALQAEEDLTLIKKAGFNLVKFKGFFPEPFLLNLCQKIGLIPAIEIPLENPPQAFVEENNYINRIKSITFKTAKYYSYFPLIKLFGLGTFGGNTPEEKQFLSNIAKQAADNGFVTFASFLNLPAEGIENIDYFGLEVYGRPIKKALETLKNSAFKTRSFVGEISYPNNYGKTNGYLNSFSNEAQAKYFSDLILLSGKMKLNGFIINSIFNYRGNFCSLYARYDEHNIYRLGLTNESRNPNSFSLNIIRRLLKYGKTTPIPMGTNKNSSPMFFIIVGLILGIIMGLLSNSKRKFREDGIRALFRPYNFFADVRDRRILISFQTIVLTLLLATIHGLLLTIILFYLRMNILFEKILLSFNSYSLIKFFSYLSWHPVKSFIILSLLTLLLFLFLTIIIKIASGFVKQKVLYSNIFNVVVWSFLPLTILLPLELILHKLLLLGFLNIYIYAVLLLFLIWVIKRILRGIYVIYDVNPYSVYTGGLLLLLVTFGIIFIYYQSEFYTYNYIVSALKQFPLF